MTVGERGRYSRQICPTAGRSLVWSVNPEALPPPYGPSPEGDCRTSTSERPAALRRPVGCETDLADRLDHARHIVVTQLGRKGQRYRPVSDPFRIRKITHLEAECLPIEAMKMERGKMHTGPDIFRLH